MVNFQDTTNVFYSFVEVGLESYQQKLSERFRNQIDSIGGRRAISRQFTNHQLFESPF